MDVVNKNLSLILILLLLLGGVWYFFLRQGAQVPTETGMEVTVEGQMMVNLLEQNDSGETGTATLTEQNGQVVVTLEMLGSPAGVPQPAHIHTGVCPEVGGVSYPLTSVLDGMSETTLDVTLAELEAEMPLAINVHKSVSEASVYTSCGDLEF